MITYFDTGLLLETACKNKGPNCFVLVSPRTIPKTSSGKIARTRTRKSYEGQAQSKSDKLQIVFKWHQADKVDRLQPVGGTKSDVRGPTRLNEEREVIQTSESMRPRNHALLETPKAQKLMADLKDEIVLLLPEDSGVTPEAIDERRPLLQLGLDSMLLEQFKSTLASDYSIEVDIEMLFQNITNLEVVVELILKPESTLRMLREEVEKHRINVEPDGERNDHEGGEGKEHEKNSTGNDVDHDSSKEKDHRNANDDTLTNTKNISNAMDLQDEDIGVAPSKPKFVDADDNEDQKRQYSTPCANTGCMIS